MASVWLHYFRSNWTCYNSLQLKPSYQTSWRRNRIQLTEFLNTVITTPTSGYFLLASGYNGTWKEHWFQYPSEVNEIVYKAKDLAAKNQNVYFTSHLFSSPKSIKANVLPTDTIQADLDSADVHTLPVKPTIIVETSPGRYQAYWIVKKDKEQPLTAQGLEELSKRLTYSITDCDRSGWSLGHRVRLPDTFNFKYDTPHHIKILTNNPRRVPLEELQVLPDLDTNQREVLLHDIEWADQPHLHLNLPPMLTMKELADEGKVHKAVYRNYDKVATDRSTVLWRLLLELVKSGIGRDLTYWLAFNSANNKFKDRYNGVRDLRKDILRAEKRAIRNDLDLRETIRLMRQDKQYGKALVERMDAMAHVIIDDLRKYGNFINARGYSLFFVPKESGKPISLHERSRYLSTLLATRYGLNSATQEYKFIVAQITAYVHNLAPTEDIRVLAFHDDLSESMYLHLGMRDVLHITDSNITVVNNGDDDVIFGLRSFNDPIQPDYTPQAGERKWFEELFSSSLDYIMSPTKERALAILSAWFLMILFRNSIHTRPILAVLGQQGSGKSTLLRLVYKLIYGKARDLANLGKPDDYDLSVSHNPLVAFDNLDTFINWLPNALATSTTETETEKRALYTDSDLIRVKKSAIVAVTAHSPKFIREDVVDRLLVIMLRRREIWGDDKELVARILAKRNRMWGQIITDIQSILASTKPHDSESPNIRMKDFATTGLWFARALNQEKDFIEGLTSVQGGQQSLLIETESLLVDAITTWATKNHLDIDEWVTPKQIWSNIQRGLESTPNSLREFNRVYRNEVVFASKLLTMQSALKQRFDIDFKLSNQGTRVWRIQLKTEIVQ